MDCWTDFGLGLGFSMKDSRLCFFWLLIGDWREQIGEIHTQQPGSQTPPVTMRQKPSLEAAVLSPQTAPPCCVYLTPGFPSITPAQATASTTIYKERLSHSQTHLQRSIPLEHHLSAWRSSGFGPAALLPILTPPPQVNKNKL